MEEVYTGMRTQPQAWIGRTVRLRATLLGTDSYRLCPVNPRAISPSHLSRHPDIAWVYLGPATWRPSGQMGLHDGWTTHPLRTFNVSGMPPMPAQEMIVQLRAPHFQIREPRQPLPALLYQLPLVGQFLPRAIDR